MEVINFNAIMMINKDINLNKNWVQFIVIFYLGKHLDHISFLPRPQNQTPRPAHFLPIRK